MPKQARKGVGNLFYRVMNAKYKGKEYIYLKLLESRREGDKIKQRLLANLSGAGHLPFDKVKPLLNELNQTLDLYGKMSETGPPWCKYLKTSYLLALENAFRVEQRCQELDLREILLKDGKRKQTAHQLNNFYSLIDEKAREQGMSREHICWLENMADSMPNDPETPACFLLDGFGFPLKTLLMNEPEEGMAGLVAYMKNIKEQVIFLAPTCERLYITLRKLGLTEKEKAYTFKEIFLYKQLTDWSAQPVFSMEKLTICGMDSCLSDEKVKGALLAASNFKNHLSYINERIGLVIRGLPLPLQDLTGIYFISFFFKRIFDDIVSRHNL